MVRNGGWATGKGLRLVGVPPLDARWIEFGAGNTGGEDNLGMLSANIEVEGEGGLLSAGVLETMGVIDVVGNKDTLTDGGGGGGIAL